MTQHTNVLQGSGSIKSKASEVQRGLVESKSFSPNRLKLTLYHPIHDHSRNHYCARRQSAEKGGPIAQQPLLSIPNDSGPLLWQCMQDWGTMWGILGNQWVGANDSALSSRGSFSAGKEMISLLVHTAWGGLRTDKSHGFSPGLES